MSAKKREDIWSDLHKASENYHRSKVDRDKDLIEICKNSSQYTFKPDIERLAIKNTAPINKDESPLTYQTSSFTSNSQSSTKLKSKTKKIKEKNIKNEIEESPNEPIVIDISIGSKT